MRTPTNTPVKIKPKRRLSRDAIAMADANDDTFIADSPASVNSISRTNSPASTDSSDDDTPTRPTKRPKLDLDSGIDASSDTTTMVNTANSPTKISMISTEQLAALRQQVSDLQLQNAAFAKRHTEDAKKASKGRDAVNRAKELELENARLERELEREQAANVDLQVELGELAATADQSRELGLKNIENAMARVGALVEENRRLAAVLRAMGVSV